MDNLSIKAKIIYATMDQLGAYNRDNKVTSYTILDYIIEQNEELYEHPIFKNMPEEDFMDITIEINIKSVSAILTSLARKNIIIGTEPMNIKVNGTNRNLKQYYINKKL